MSLEDRPDSDDYTIREVGQELGVSFRTLRFYEAKGLIAPTRDRRRRIYARQDIEQLRVVLKLKAFGLSLMEIRRIIREPHEGPYGLSRELCEELIERLTERQQSTEAALAQLEQIALQFLDNQTLAPTVGVRPGP